MMPDNLTKEQRRRTMQLIQSKNTTAELRTRSFLHALGFRFRLHDQSLPGKPDIVLRKHRTVIFVHGCFWHQHGCARCVVPKTNQTYWIPKLQANVARDKVRLAELRAAGWNVAVVWECEISEIDLRKRFRSLVRRRAGPRS
jgi:DNA mismatch endonuclease (patch repair protein)